MTSILYRDDAYTLISNIAPYEESNHLYHANKVKIHNQQIISLGRNRQIKQNCKVTEWSLNKRWN